MVWPTSWEGVTIGENVRLNILQGQQRSLLGSSGPLGTDRPTKAGLLSFRGDFSEHWVRRGKLFPSSTIYGRRFAALALAHNITAKLRFHHSRSFGCQLNLVGVVLFVPLLRSSARHIRAPVAEENLRNSPAAIGSSYCWQ